MLLSLRPEGLFCPPGDFYIDPWKPVERAVITHGHSDHARSGMKRYLCVESSAPILRTRLGDDISLQTAAYGETIEVNGVSISFHPAGHVTGSAQVRLKHRGEIWVVSGDYKTEPDRINPAFEPIRCHGFVTETTFGLPVYRWRSEETLMREIDAWWAENRSLGRTSVIFAYSLGKAQRILAGVDAAAGPLLVHGAVGSMNLACEAASVRLPKWHTFSNWPSDSNLHEALVLAPPSANGTPWMRRFKEASTAFASGWMAIRGARRRRAVDRGFVVSDHVDWPALLSAVEATGAEEIWTTHGYAETVARYLGERGKNAKAIQTEFVGEQVDTVEAEEEPLLA